MTTVDIVLLLLILVGAISGFRQGFLMALFSISALILGVLGALKLMATTVTWLSAKIDINETVLPYLAFAVVFIAIVIGVNLLGRLIKVSIDRTFLGKVDQAAGAGVGLLKAVFLLSVSLWILQALNINLPERWVGESWLLPRIESFAPGLTMWLADYIPFFEDIFK